MDPQRSAGHIVIGFFCIFANIMKKQGLLTHKEAVKKAPKDPLVLSYYGTCLFYAPKPFGSKKEALSWFERAKKQFDSKPSAYRYCWVREANDMYIGQCKEKLNKK